MIFREIFVHRLIGKNFEPGVSVTSFKNNYFSFKIEISQSVILAQKNKEPAHFRILQGYNFFFLLILRKNDTI